MTAINHSSLNKCQTCLGELVKNLTIQSLSVSGEMLSLLTFLSVKVIDGLSNSVCMKCVDTFESIITFKHQCSVSQTILQNRYKKLILDSDDSKEELAKPSCLADNEIHLEVTIKEEDGKVSTNYSDENKEKNYRTFKIVGISEENVKSDYSDEANIEKNIESDEVNSEKKLLANRKGFKRNKKLAKETNVTSCSECDFTCNTLAELEDHSQNKHDTVCNICNKKLVSNSNLRRHREIHQTDRPKYYCEICKRFYAKQTYECHMKKFHSNVNREKVVCTLCGIAVYSIKSHIKSRHPDPTDTFKCQYCGRVFKSPTSLRCHELIYHINPQNYQSLCPECGRVFRTSGDMKAHLRRKHSDERKVKCRHCDKTFKTCSHRGRHERVVHLNERRYKCDLCFKAFTDKAVLENHIRIHTGEKPFVCEICSRAFSQNAALRTHLKLVHGLTKVKLTSSSKKIELINEAVE